MKGDRVIHYYVPVSLVDEYGYIEIKVALHSMGADSSNNGHLTVAAADDDDDIARLLKDRFLLLFLFNSDQSRL